MKRYSRLVTMVATLLIGGLLGVAAWQIRWSGAGPPDPGPRPLHRFDGLIAREELDEPLRPAAIHEAERFLAAVLDEAPPARSSRRPATTQTRESRQEIVRGALARQAVILGEAHRFGLDAATNTSTVFRDVLRCAYGAPPPGSTCADLFAAGVRAGVIADARAQAGAWAGSRACLNAAWNAHLPDVHRQLLDDTHKLLAGSKKLGGLVGRLSVAALVSAAIAAVILRQRRAEGALPAAAPPALLPAPWLPAALHAALVRCGLYALLGTALLVALAALVRAQTVGLVATAGVYALGLGLLARLVFKRFGLSWLDGFRARPGSQPAADLALAAVATIGLDHGGRMAVGLLAMPFTDLSPAWSEVPAVLDQPSVVAMLGEIAALVLLAPLAEELLFRRVIFTLLRSRWGLAPALAASAVGFGLLHLYTPVATATIAWAGFAYAWSVYRTGSLWPAFVAHAAGNALAVLGSGG